MPLLTEAPLATLEALPGITLRLTQEPSDVAPAILVLASASGISRYAAEERKNVTAATVNAVLAKLQDMRGDGRPSPLLLTSYLTPAVIDRLMAEGFEFADASGNVYLDGPAAYVVILGRKSVTGRASTELTPADLKLIFALLARPRLLRRTYREIAAATGVSTGKISGTINKLEASGHLRRTESRTLKVMNAARLLDRWEHGYLERLRPELHPGTYRLLGPSSLEEVKRRTRGWRNVLVGGEHAAAHMTQHLKPATLTLHVPAHETKGFAVEMKLPRSSNGPTVLLLDRFEMPDGDIERADIRQDETASVGTERAACFAHPILVRAELLALDDDRLREVANRLREPILRSIEAP